MKPSIVIIATSGANFTSLQAAFLRLGYESNVTEDSQVIRAATHVILPGVGMAQYAMRALKEKGLSTVIASLTQPVLGICLGMQLLCTSSEEGETACLNIMPLTVKKLVGETIYPHMGWNQIKILDGENSLLQGISYEEDFYFVHGFAPSIATPYTQAICEYGMAFSACIQHRNFYGVQFHPEKSGKPGERILKNFLSL